MANADSARMKTGIMGCITETSFALDSTEDNGRMVLFV